MATLYKLTDSNGQTRGKTQWGEGVEHAAPGGALCSSGVLHAYRSPLIAVLMDPIHGRFGAMAQLWEANGDVCADDGTKVGCTRLRTVRQSPLPQVTTEQRVRFAIFAARRIIGDRCPEWSAWAERWLDGDRSAETAEAAEAAAEAAGAAWAAWAAWAAA